MQYCFEGYGHRVSIAFRETPLPSASLLLLIDFLRKAHIELFKNNLENHATVF